MIKAADINFADIVQCRSADDAVAELREAITNFNQLLHSLARQHPGVVGLAGICYGKPLEAFVITPSAGIVHYSPVAPQRLKALAWIVAHLPEELRREFEQELALIPKPAEVENLGVRPREVPWE